MSTIRKQSIISTLLIYAGFVFGAINTYLFTQTELLDTSFTLEQYGLTRAFIVTGSFLYGFASFGLPAVIYKFYPYYKDNLDRKDNDLLSICLVIALIGFLMTTVAGIILEPLVIRKFSAKSRLLVQYYFWIFPFLFFYLFFSILEAYAWSLKKTILPNFLKEAGFRISTTILIVLFFVGAIDFPLFIKLFSFLYAFSFIMLLLYLVQLKQFRFTLKFSRVTKKFWKKMLTLMLFVYAGVIIQAIAQSIDSFTIVSYGEDTADPAEGLKYLAIYDFATYVCSLVQVPQRSMISISIPVLSQAWKDKDLTVIKRVYSRSSLNLLMISLFIFLLIWLNYDDAIDSFGLNPMLKAGKIVVLLLGLKFIIDMGTGVNAQIIGTSVFWRFEFLSGVVLLLLAVPLNVILVKRLGIEGAAWSSLIAFTTYNIIRLQFLWRKFRMQPFTPNTAYVLLHALACYGICYLLFGHMHDFGGMVLRSVVFVVIFTVSAFYFKLSPDIEPVWKTIRKKLF
ncbi:MAG TPA: polysaccharide biosynthesis C-terminal domain-containing protein [Chitinophagaceae bacterium]|nr:polysaccharide biosynthesis C-terminal domain-containing protein [Chitinophagaceae bacterium]